MIQDNVNVNKPKGLSKLQQIIIAVIVLVVWMEYQIYSFERMAPGMKALGEMQKSFKSNNGNSKAPEIVCRTDTREAVTGNCKRLEKGDCTNVPFVNLYSIATEHFVIKNKSRDEILCDGTKRICNWRDPEEIKKGKYLWTDKDGFDRMTICSANSTVDVYFKD